MKIRPLFNRYQGFLLAFANTSFGRDYLLSKDIRRSFGNLPIFKVTPDSVHFIQDKRTAQAVFYSRSPHLNKFHLPLTAMAIAEEKYKNLLNKISLRERAFVLPHFLGFTQKAWLPNVMFDTDTSYPDTHPESSTVDGYIERGPVSETFATIRAGAGSAVSDNGVLNNLPIGTTADTDRYNYLGRVPVLFDTSGIGSGQVVSDATLSGYLSASGNHNDALNQNVEVTTSNPASNTALATTDFPIANFGTTVFSTVDLGAISDGQYNDFEFNQDGKDAIEMESITKLAFRMSSDVSGSITWSASTQAKCHFDSADNASGQSQAPKLVVTYAPPVAETVDQWYRSPKGPIFLPPKIVSY